MRGCASIPTVLIVFVVVSCSAGSGTASAGAGNFERFANSYCQWLVDCGKTSRTVGDCVTELRTEDGGFFAKCTLLQEQYARPEVNACMTPQRPCGNDKVAVFCPEIDWATLEPRCKSLARDGG